MKGLNLKPSRVYQTATMLLESRAIQRAPPWYGTIGAIPPAEILTRTLPVQHRETGLKSRKRKPSKMFQPQPISYEEDKLRKEFYKDHPWELARPRIVLENDGREGQICNWSSLQQPGVPLTGESVVKRQMWLMDVAGKDINEAYDIARKEFYALRHAEEIEQRVAKEEALWTGAHFGKGPLDVGMELEDKAYEDWKAWATEEVSNLTRQRDAAYSGVEATKDEAILAADSDAEDVEQPGKP